MNSIDHIKLVVSSFITALVLLNGITNAQTVYEWRGDVGERSFSDIPPENTDLQSTGIEVSTTDRTAVIERESAKREAPAEDAVAKQMNNEEALNNAEIAAKKKAQSAANCAKASNKLTLFTNNRRIYRQGPDGEVTEWLDIDEERTKAQKEVDTYCQ